MSIAEIVVQLVEQKRLFPHRSETFEQWDIPEEDQSRKLYLSADVSAAVAKPLEDTQEGERLARFRAWLDGFVEGMELTVAEDPHEKPAWAMLARVCPIEAELWSIRVTDPEETPGIRSIGGFCLCDEFVALTWNMREVIDRDFDAFVEESRAIWSDYFGSVSPHRGKNINAYLSECEPV